MIFDYGLNHAKWVSFENVFYKHAVPFFIQKQVKHAKGWLA